MVTIVYGQEDPRPIFTSEFQDNIFKKKGTYTAEEMSEQLGLGIAAVDGESWNYGNDTIAESSSIWRMPFTLKVDDFTALTVLGSYKSDWFKNGSHIWFEGTGWEGGYSTLKQFQNENMVVPQLTIIIQIKDGKIVGMEWDDANACLGCDAGSCIDGFCAIPKSQCGLESVTCDLKVYIGWIGTDTKGNYMTSAGRRLSQFRNYSLKDTFDVAYKTYEDEVPAEMREKIEG